MALWGNKDSKSATGTIQIYANGLCSGTGTLFDTELKVGDYITVANVDYQVISYTSNVAVNVIAGKAGASIATVAAGNAYALSEKSRYITLTDGKNNSNNVFGVSVNEAQLSNGTIKDYILTFNGSGYSANATVTASGGAGNTVAFSANALSNSSGRIASLPISNVGANFTLAPSLAISAPSAIAFSGNSTSVNVTSDFITLGANGAFFANGDTVTYNVAAGNTAITPLVNNTPYFVVFANSTGFALSTIKNGANVDITAVAAGAQAGHTFTGETATAVAEIYGDHAASAAGWVLRREGTGGRAGRVQFETLVAMRSITGDAENSVFANT